MSFTGEPVLLGTRIPSSLKEDLSDYCSSHGIKLNYFVTKAIKDKLDEMLAEEVDKKIVGSRMKNARYFPQKKLDQYLLRRKSRRDL